MNQKLLKMISERILKITMRGRVGKVECKRVLAPDFVEPAMSFMKKLGGTDERKDTGAR